jgi:hypothetical protein
MGTSALPQRIQAKVAGSTAIKRGWLCMYNASGYLVPATASTTLSSAGIAEEDIDTTGISDGVKSITVIQGTVDLAFGDSGDAITDANLSAPTVWAIDNQTVGATSGSSARSVAGVFMGINPDTGLARVWVGPAAFAVGTALLDAGGNVTQANSEKLTHTESICIRGVVDANVASLSAFAGVSGGTAVNGVTYVAGDIVLLVKQTTAAQNGFYVVGTVGGGVAPLTRPSWWAAAAAIPPGTRAEVGYEDTAYPGTTWIATCVTGKVVGTDDPIFYPKTQGGVVTLAVGVKVVSTTQKVWLKSTTVSRITVTRDTANTTTATTGGYAVPVGDRVAGVIGTGSFKIYAQAADGSTNTADISTMCWTLEN